MIDEPAGGPFEMSVVRGFKPREIRDVEDIVNILELN